MRRAIVGAVLAACLSIGAARAETVLVTNVAGGGEIAIAVRQIEAVQPRDSSSCFVWVGSHRVAIAEPYVQVLNLMSAEAPAGKAVRK